MTTLKRILQFATCLLLLMAVAINRDGRVFGHEISTAGGESPIVENDERVADNGSRIISTRRLAKDVYGFGGNVPLEIYIGPEGRIDSVKPLPNSESPEFFNKVISSGLLEQWNGMKPEKAIIKNVDAITGATMSSTAIIESVRKGLSSVTDSNAESSASHLLDIRFWCVIMVILAGMVLPIWLKSKRYRYIQLILNVIVLGLWSGCFLSLSSVVNLCSQGVMLSPAWVIAILMVVTAFIYPFFGKSGHYCAWICPLGSCQELIGKSIPYKLKIKPKTIELLTTFREALWVIILAVMWLGVGFELMDYELFTAFMFRQASWPIITVALIVAALSGVVQRPYCRFICPTGTTIKYSQQIK